MHRLREAPPLDFALLSTAAASFAAWPKESALTKQISKKRCGYLRFRGTTGGTEAFFSMRARTLTARWESKIGGMVRINAPRRSPRRVSLPSERILSRRFFGVNRSALVDVAFVADEVADARLAGFMSNTPMNPRCSIATSLIAVS